MDVRASFQNELLTIKALLEDGGAALSESWIQGENYSLHLDPTSEAWLNTLKQMTKLGKGHLAGDGDGYQKLRVFLGDTVFIPREKTVLYWIRLI